MGEVSTLGVRGPWRRNGLGIALLRHSFAEFYRLGKRRVILGVDSQNLMDAPRLYECAAIHIDMQYDAYQKNCVRVMKLSTQSL
jgi:ribosomal protein S18 acetylase RimI-like enzyme